MTAHRLAGLLLWLMPPASLFAAPWVFAPAIDVNPVPPGSNKYFHHIDSSGRRNIAVSDNQVAIAWEDDRDATPRIYLSYKMAAGAGFSKEIRISGDGEAYEPSLAALSGGRYLVAWEEEGHTYARVAAIDGGLKLGPIAGIGNGSTSQVSLTTSGDKVAAVWSQRDGRYGRIHAARFAVDDKQLLASGTGCPVDPVPPTDEQLYPSAIFSGDRLLVAWEDRRPKHTIIMAAVEREDNTCDFSEPLRISEKPHGRNLPYGAGHGVSRVALGRYGRSGAFAVWADKRSFRNGYDIWGAPYSVSENRFGGNEMVQDDFGGLAKQRHATVAGSEDATLVVAWDDEREGDTDIVLSWRVEGEWSDDWPVPVASGEGRQGSPSMVLDQRGNLHLTWVERQLSGATTALKYAFGRRLDTP